MREQGNYIYLVDVIFRDGLLGMLGHFLSIIERDFIRSDSCKEIRTWSSHFSELYELMKTIGFKSYCELDPLFVTIFPIADKNSGAFIDQCFAYSMGDSDMI